VSDVAPRRTAIWIVVPIAVGFALLIVLFATSDPAIDRATNSTAVGRVAPLIEADDLDGRRFNIDDHRGRWA
jgi:cytochrome oxidase Cu insertion factor (SCO1/SenC/PrrC family)